MLQPMHLFSRELVQQLLNDNGEQSFNRITIDGDTSTNDSCIYCADRSGVALKFAVKMTHVMLWCLDVLARIMLRLAQLIVRDGEGATKFITVRVEGGCEYPRML